MGGGTGVSVGRGVSVDNGVGMDVSVGVNEGSGVGAMVAVEGGVAVAVGGNSLVAVGVVVTVWVNTAGRLRRVLVAVGARVAGRALLLTKNGVVACNVDSSTSASTV